MIKYLPFYILVTRNLIIFPHFFLSQLFLFMSLFLLKAQPLYSKSSRFKTSGMSYLGVFNLSCASSKEWKNGEKTIPLKE